ncbi:hypothetical protein EDB81DRAFT_845946 [Dactylonectria macrodidyma]|uniref:Uncharacterized protein n=1 Tax=Dactylonectria macrodidyma TaxID=307937 RepID=A0A9P9DYU0_9HYPO|nr:hypothetical protein EDB81DRAFT_845946 [Dactylonectria macrodidyma]
MVATCSDPEKLEECPNILPRAQAELFSLLTEALSLERANTLSSGKRSILDVEVYDQAALGSFLAAKQGEVLEQREAYTKRRSSGGSRELLVTRQSAERWLRESAPVKYVDGAWLGHVHKITTPFALRGVTKAAWQVLSEELGDGDLQKNHVYLYRALLESIGVQLPAGDSAGFIRDDLWQVEGSLDNNTRVWKAAVAQLLISLFPNEFLPEILGFNMHYELLTLDTLMASQELPELKISSYYFIPHVSVDNADSGHAAMARSMVADYLAVLKATPSGAMNEQEAWRRVQAGYLLSKTLGSDYEGPYSSSPASTVVGDDTTATTADVSEDALTGEEPLSQEEAYIADLLLLKANVSQKIHCPGKLRVGKRPLSDWFLREAWRTRREFIDALANATPWVRAGLSSSSLLIRELAWEGRMFGAFTHTEVEALSAWIDGLSTPEEKTYRNAVRVGRRQLGAGKKHYNDVAANHPILLSEEAHILSVSPEDALFPCPKNKTFVPQPLLQVSSDSLAALLSLWFTHSALLENTVNAPFKTTTALHSQIVRILRAELGFMPETAGVAGMDERSRSGYWPSIVDLGLELAHGLPGKEPQSLKDVLGNENDDEGGRSGVVVRATKFAYAMLRLALQPVKNLGLLLGLARAFLDLEKGVASAELLLCSDSRNALQLLLERKAACFDRYLHLLEQGSLLYGDFVRGCRIGRAEIEKATEL